MPHPKRYECQVKVTVPGSKPLRVVTPTRQAIHLRCSVCGLMARVDLVEGGPYGSYSRCQTYGGAYPGGQGVMHWSDAVELTSEQLALLRKQTALAGQLLGLDPQEYPPLLPEPKPDPVLARLEQMPARERPKKVEPKEPRPEPKPKKPIVPKALKEEIATSEGIIVFWKDKMEQEEARKLEGDQNIIKRAREKIALEETRLAKLMAGEAPPPDSFRGEPLVAKMARAEKEAAKLRRLDRPKAEPEPKPTLTTEKQTEYWRETAEKLAGGKAKAKPAVKETKKARRETKKAKPETPALPEFKFPARLNAASADKLIQRLGLLEKWGEGELQSPEGQAELERLKTGVETWREQTEESKDKAEEKEKPNEERVDELTTRLEGLQDLNDSLEEGAIEDAIEDAQGLF